MSSVFDRVKTIVVEQLDCKAEDVVPSATFVEDLEADSLDLVELMMSLEEEFSRDASSKLEISDEEAEKIVSVQAAVDYLKNHGVQDS